MIEYYHKQPCDCTVCFHQKRVVEMARKETIKEILDIWTYANKEAMNTKQLLREVRHRIGELKQSLDNQTPSTKPQNTGSENCLSRKTTDGMDNRYSEDKTRENIPKEKSK